MPILPRFGRQKKFFNRHHFLFWKPPVGKNFAYSVAGNLSYIASSASSNRIGYAKVFRDKGERGDNLLSPAGSSALRVGSECRPYPPDTEHRTGNGAIHSTLHGSAPCHLTCCRRLACCTILYPLGEPNTPTALRRRVC